MKIFKVPYDQGGGEKSLGASYGPDAIQEQFEKRPWRTAEDGTPHPPVMFHRVVQQGRERDSIFDSYRCALRLTLSAGERSFATLSGDNSCSFYTVKTVAEHFSDPQLIIFDAHPDCCDEAHDPHANWVRRLWEGNIVTPAKTIFFGIRDSEKAELAYLKEKRAIVYSCDKLFQADMKNIVWELTIARRIKESSALVLVVDIDVLDPSQAPGTGVLRAPGLDLRQVLRIISALGEISFPARAMEICEVIPADGSQFRPPRDRRPDPAGLTTLAAEAILREMVRSFA